ncbi:hypothetical protein CLOM_g77 [Closterium sp. NIES-68]|nr:hypothetical protein CLOM_g77 [Closterium sp. NIES-68]
MDARDRGGRGMDRGFGRGENLNRVVPAELAMSWQGEGGEASGGMRGDGDGSGGVWMGVGGVSERVSERVSGRVSQRVSGEMGMCAVGRGGSGEGVVAGMGVGDWSGGSSGRHGDRAGGERGRSGGWGGGGGGGEGEGEGGSTMGFRGPGRSGEMYIRRGGSSEEFKSRSGGEGSGAQGGGAQGVGPMAVSDSLMRRRREGAAYTGPIARPNLPTGARVMSPPTPQEKRHFSAEDKPRFASPFAQPGFQPRQVAESLNLPVSRPGVMGLGRPRMESAA